MFIGRKNKLEKVVADKGTQRERFEQPYLDAKRKEIQACNGRILVCIPAHISDNEKAESGYIPLKAINEFKNMIKRSDTDAKMTADKDEIIIEAVWGEIIKYSRDKSQEWPNTDKLIKTEQKRKGKQTKITFNAQFLHYLSQALGSEVLELTIGKPQEPIIVKDKKGGHGLLMPVYQPETK